MMYSFLNHMIFGPHLAFCRILCRTLRTRVRLRVSQYTEYNEYIISQLHSEPGSAALLRVLTPAPPPGLGRNLLSQSCAAALPGVLCAPGGTYGVRCALDLSLLGGMQGCLTALALVLGVAGESRWMRTVHLYWFLAQGLTGMERILKDLCVWKIGVWWRAAVSLADP